MQHSASSIALANRCHRAWWHCYRDKLRPPELAWKLVKRMRARNQSLPAGAYGKALGTEMHRLAELYLTLSPRRAAGKIDWTDTPGQCLAEILPYLPPAGSVPRNRVERAVSVKVNGVAFRGLIDVVGAALDRVVEVYDHKSTRDIRAYAKLPHAVALQVKQPERSLRDDLQSCLYVLARAKATESTAEAVGGLARWNYTETQRTRRALPVVQYIPTAHARTVVASAAEVARTVEAFETIEDAVPNTLACDQFGGCWYRHEGHCRVRRNMGAVFAQSEREAMEKSNMGKPLTFASLGIATDKANKAEEAKAKAAAPAKRKPAPAPVVEEVEDAEEKTEEEEAPPPPKAKRVKPAPLPDPVEDLGEESDEPPAPVKSPRAAAKQKFDDVAGGVPEPILQYFGAAGRKGEAKILATAFAELAKHLSANLPRNPERAQCLRKLLEANDCALRAATAEA